MTQSCLKGDSTMMKGKLNETRVPSASFTLSQGIEEELLLKLYDNFHKIETEIVSSKTGDVVLYDQEKQSIDDESDDSSSHKPTVRFYYIHIMSFYIISFIVAWKLFVDGKEINS